MKRPEVYTLLPCSAVRSSFCAKAENERAVSCISVVRELMPCTKCLIKYVRRKNLRSCREGGESIDRIK